MKTVFEGKVNGQVFDNVADYNAALVEALKHGNVEASSNTKTVPDEDIEQTCCDNEVECCCEACEEPDWFPGLDKDDYYMDSMVGQNDKDKDTYNEWKEYLEDNYQDVVEFYKQLTPEDQDNYLNDLKLIALKQVSDDKCKNEQALESLVVEREDLKERLQKLDKDIAVLGNAGQLNNMFNQYYTTLIKQLESMVAAKPVPQVKETETEACPIKTQTKEVQPQVEMCMDGIRRLLQEIFPGARFE